MRSEYRIKTDSTSHDVWNYENVGLRSDRTRKSLGFKSHLPAEDYKNPNSPPNDIMSDYYPELGAYSSNDELVMAKQLAMIRQSGIGVIAISYWPGETSDDRLAKLFAKYFLVLFQCPEAAILFEW